MPVPRTHNQQVPPRFVPKLIFSLKQVCKKTKKGIPNICQLVRTDTHTCARGQTETNMLPLFQSLGGRIKIRRCSP